MDADPLTGVSTHHHYDPVTKVTTIRESQDIEPHINMNKALHNTSYQRDGIKNDMMHAAHIPDGIILEWMKEGINVYNPDHMPRILRKLNDPEYKYLKTGNAKL
jgi:hypothetical protein